MLFKETDSTPYHQALLDACLKDLAYDSQCEEGRAPYLWRIIALSKNRNFFRNGILKALQNCGDLGGQQPYWRQVFGLARYFSAENDQDMKKAMYAAFESLGFDGAGDSAAEQLIHLDGIDGFSKVMTQFDSAGELRDEWEFFSLVDALAESIGKDEALSILTEKALGDERLHHLLKAFHEHQILLSGKSADKTISDQPESYDVLKGRLSEKKFTLTHFSRWSKTATQEELKVAADDLLDEKDEHRLRSYLFIFKDIPFPSSVNGLLSLADDERKFVKHGAIQALRNASHPLVRQRALELLNSPVRASDGVALLCSNLESGDFSLIEAALLQASTDEQLHDLGFSVRYIIEKSLTPEAENALLILYEKNPCSLCRSDCVRYLIELRKLPDWLCAECRYDADSDTVKLAE